jgi:hypothetical protein
MLRGRSRREPVLMRTPHQFTRPIVRENPRPAPDPKAAASIW